MNSRRVKHRLALALLVALPATAFAQDATASIPADPETEIVLPQAVTATPVVPADPVSKTPIAAVTHVEALRKEAAGTIEAAITMRDGNPPPKS